MTNFTVVEDVGDDELKYSSGEFWRNIFTPQRATQLVIPIVFIITCVVAGIRHRRRRIARQRELAEAAAGSEAVQGSDVLSMNGPPAPPVNISTVGGVAYPRQTTLSSGFVAYGAPPSSGCVFGAPYGESAASSNLSGGYTYTNIEFKY